MQPMWAKTLQEEGGLMFEEVLIMLVGIGIGFTIGYFFGRQKFMVKYYESMKKGV